MIVDAWAWSYVQPFLEAKPRTVLVFSLEYWVFLDAFFSAQIAAGLVGPLPDGVTVRSAGKRGVSLRGRGFHMLPHCRHTYK